MSELLVKVLTETFSTLSRCSSLSMINLRFAGSVLFRGERERMPLYDCMLLVKPRVVKEGQLDLIVRIAQHVFRRNGVITDIKSFGNVFLGYGIKKLDGRYYQVGMPQILLGTLVVSSLL